MKKYILLIVVIITIFLIYMQFIHKNESSKSPEQQINSEQIQNNKISKNSKNIPGADKNIKEKSHSKQLQKQSLDENDDNYIKKANLYNSDNGVVVPLSTISIISTLPQNIQDKVLKIAETNNIFMTKRIKDKLLVITDNPDNIRHCIEFTEISINNGHQVKTTLGYNDKMKDSDNDIWEYDENTKQPVRHSKYNKDGDVEFVETWHYDDNPIKYEMKDADGHTISIRKETLDDGTNLRVEHLIYDKSGKTKINVSTTYDGADIKRFTYYNADKPSDGGSVFAEYSDGLKTKETVYSNDLKVVNTYTSEYKNGEREDITIWNSNNKEIEKLVPNESSEVL